MDMEIIDTVAAYTLEVGDYILFDGTICAVKEVFDPDDATSIVTIFSEDDRERFEFWFAPVDIYGYSSVEV